MLTHLHAFFNAQLSSELPFVMDNVYAIDNLRVSSIMYETNVPAIAPMRAFTSLENIFIIESIVSDVAIQLGLPQLQVCKSVLSL